jgi:hypothetical protein
MTNRSTLVLAILAANDRLGQSEIHRTWLVKQVYLAETIRPLYRMWRQAFAFVRYYYGPYSDDIFFALDTLIFNGLAEVTKHQLRGGRVEATYKVTRAGSDLVDQVVPQEFKQLGSDLVWALQTLGVQNVGAICRLVYREAEFAKIFSSHLNAGISAETKVSIPSVTEANNETFLTLALLQRLQMTDGAADFNLPSREIVRIFFENLARRLFTDSSSEQ